MTFSDEIAALNAYTRTAFREIIDRGLANDVPSTDIASAVHGLILFEHDLVPPPDPIVELGKAVLALADRPAAVINVTTPPVTIYPPDVSVAPADVKVDVHLPEPKPVKRRIERDAEGRITGSTEEV